MTTFKKLILAFIGRDSGIGYAVGAQTGVLQQVSQTASVELGYRYQHSNASTEMSERGGRAL